MSMGQPNFFCHMTQSKVFDQAFVLSIRLRSGVVRGGQPLTGVQGCPLVLSLSLAPPAARKKKEKGFFGEYKPHQACLRRTPAKGWPPFAIPLEKWIEVTRTHVLKVCFVSCIHCDKTSKLTGESGIARLSTTTLPMLTPRLYERRYQSAQRELWQEGSVRYR